MLEISIDALSKIADTYVMYIQSQATTVIQKKKSECIFYEKWNKEIGRSN
jgi:hypothetical protein